MKISVQNNTDLSNKHIRLLKWKIYRIKQKFDHLLYAEVYLTQEGKTPAKYKAVVKLGIPGNDIMLVHTSESPSKLWRSTFQDAQRYLRKHKERTLQETVAAPQRMITDMVQFPPAYL